MLIATAIFLPIAAAAIDYHVPTRYELRHPKSVNKSVIGIVEKMLGPCFVIRGGKGGKVGISLGLRTYENDKVITADRSRLHVRYKDGTYVELGAESGFEVERVRFKPLNPLPAYAPSDNFDESVFRFEHGIARVTAPDVHPLEYFTIKTANAIIRVTGPADFYLIQLLNDRDLTIRVSRGKVETMNAITNEKLQVPENQGAYVKVSGVVSSAGHFTQDQLDFLKSRTRI
jgi:hypothetical protein